MATFLTLCLISLAFVSCQGARESASYVHRNEKPSISYSGSHFNLKHKFTDLPGSSGGQGAMTWDHFKMLKKHDLARVKWLAGARAKQGLEGRGRRNSEIGGDFELSGNTNPTSAGLYWTKIGLGTPSRDFSVQIDTGSDVLWVQCQPCESCGTTSELVSLAAPFDPASSSTYTEGSCGSSACQNLQTTQSQLGVGCNSEDTSDQKCYYELVYGDGSTSTGSLATDMSSFLALNGSVVSSEIMFGCAFKQTGNLHDGNQLVDGLMGLGRGFFSVATQLTKNGVISGEFAHCLGGEVDGGGSLILGTVEADGLVYSPLVRNLGLVQYYLTAEAVTLNGSALQNVDASTFGEASRNEGTILDSGTTLALVPDLVFNGLLAKVEEYTTLELLPLSQTSDQYCWLYTGKKAEDFPKYFPSGTIEFTNASMTLTPENYLLILVSTTGTTQAACLGWLSASQAGFPITVIGDVVLRNKLVVFDNNLDRVGWVDIDCKKATISTQNVTTVRGPSSSSNAPKVGLHVITTLLLTFFYLIFVM